MTDHNGEEKLAPFAEALEGGGSRAFTKSPGQRERATDDFGISAQHHRGARAAPADIELLDFAPAPTDLLGEVIAGLSQNPKTLPCKLFYDSRGSELFDRICELPEYYPTRTEVQITRDHADEIAQLIGPGALLVEFGSGSSLKTRTLLDHLKDPAGYVPIDISRSHLMRSCRQLAVRYPHLRLQPICADYTSAFHLPMSNGTSNGSAGRVVAYFPGSTIGNFEPEQARAFLRSVKRVCGPGSALLIGVDLEKHHGILDAAYNDSAGITAAFNVNMLQRINRELGADFALRAFAHRAFYNTVPGRVEMHLVSRCRQSVRLPAHRAIRLEEGESIHTENCYKYTIPGFHAISADAGYRPVRVWSDPLNWFSVHYLRDGSH